MHLMFDTWTQERYGPKRRERIHRLRRHEDGAMDHFTRGLFVTSMGLWAGAGIFFSAVTLPTLFMNMEPTDAGRIAALLFPGYYAFGLGAGALSLVAAGILSRSGGRVWYGVAFAVALALACQAYATASVRPRMSEIRGVASDVAEFQRLHRVSVRLNAVVLVLTSGLLATGARLTGRH
jgi:hypothetical protein